MEPKLASSVPAPQPSERVPVRVHIDVSAIEDALPLTVSVRDGKTFRNAAWDTFDPVDGGHYFQPPEESHILDTQVGTLEFDVPESEWITVFVYSRERNFHFRKTYRLGHDGIHVTITPDQLTTLKGQIADVSADVSGKTRLALGVRQLPFTEECTVGYVDQDGGFELRVTKDATVTLFANKNDRYGWVYVDTSEDATDIAFALHPSVKSGQLYFDSPEFETMFVALRYDDVQFVLPWPDANTASLDGVPLGTPTLYGFEFDPDLDGRFPTTERGLLREIALDRAEMGRVEVEIVSEKRSYQVRLVNVPDGFRDGMYSISGTHSSGEYFIFTDQLFDVDSSALIPDYPEFMVSGVAVQPSGERYFSKRFTRDSVVDGELVIDLSGVGTTTISGSILSAESIDQGFVELIEGTIDLRNVLRFSKSTVHLRAQVRPIDEDGTFELRHVPPGDYTLVGRAFGPTATGPISRQLAGSVRVTVGSDPVKAEIAVEEVLY